MTTPSDIARTNRFIQEQEHELWPDKPRSEFGHKDCRTCGPGPLGRGLIPSDFVHVFYYFKRFYDSYGGASSERRPCGPEQAMVVSSEVAGDQRPFHTIMLDIDMPCRLVESSTPGHYHLYVDMLLPWRRYRRLLRALMKAGVIEKGFYKASVRRKATHLRPPWLDKE